MRQHNQMITTAVESTGNILALSPVHTSLPTYLPRLVSRVPNDSPEKVVGSLRHLNRV